MKNQWNGSTDIESHLAAFSIKSTIESGIEKKNKIIFYRIFFLKMLK